jgi:zinc/manganese transport system ATP-binding protein
MTGNAVALRGATLRFGRHVIWQDLDLDVAPGQCLAVLGPNGAGKTTLLKVLLGLLPLSGGTITIDGRPPRRGSAQTGYIPQQRPRCWAPGLAPSCTCWCRPR